MVDRRNSPGPEKIVITQGQIEHLTTVFARTWQRPPTTEELEGLIRDFVRQEVYYREALARGPDRDDIVIRRRLQQKLEFILADLADLGEPTDADLNEFLRTHPDKFRIEQRLTFHHVYLNPERHGENLQQDAAKLNSRRPPMPRENPPDWRVYDRLFPEQSFYYPGRRLVTPRELAGLGPAGAGL